MRYVRGLSRLLVVAFTVVSLMLVAAVGVSATSGKDGKSDQVKNTVVALSHSIETISHEGTTGKSDGKGGEGNKGDECKAKKHENKHHHATRGHRHHPCDDEDDSD
jgi:hypothetical protein